MPAEAWQCLGLKVPAATPSDVVPKLRDPRQTLKEPGNMKAPNVLTGMFGEFVVIGELRKLGFHTDWTGA